MGVGGVLFAALALLGLHAVLTQVDWLYVGFRVAGGLYLLYLGIRLWRGAGEAVPVAGTPRRTSTITGAFLGGLATQLSNPKTALVYASVFAALLPPHLPGWALVALPVLILALESGWYVAVALVFSADGPRSAYLRAKGRLDRAAGVVMGALGTRLMVDVVR
jgi:threonine/homoserine/homoserine lactone efflux protein